MNKLLVTGVAIGRGAGVSAVSNYDLDWLIHYPSVLLWADRILVADTIWDVVKNESYPHPELARCCKIIFDTAKAEGIVEIVKPSKLINDTLQESFFSKIEHDIDQMKRIFPDKVSVKSLGKDGLEGPDEITLDGNQFCSPYLWAVYASLFLARAWRANCLFDQRVLDYLRYKFGISAFPKEADVGRVKCFTTVFESYLPNDPLIPDYAFYGQGCCSTCKHEDKCKGSYLSDLEKRMGTLLRWRDYDEIHQVKAVVNSIVAKRDKAGAAIDAEEVAKSFREKQKKLRKLTKAAFPKIKRWANVSTMLSIPLAVAGLVTGSSIVKLTGAGVVGMAQLSKEYVKFLESKYSWVGFLQNMSVPCEERKEN